MKLKVRIRNTWDWVDVELDKHDVDYIALHCATRNELSPALRKRGKKWYLDFSFEEKVILKKVSLDTQRVLGVDLGINNACVCSVMDSKGTIIGRRFKKLPVEQDSLERALRRIRKAQSNGGECQDFCVWGGYSRGSPTRLPFVFEMQYARPDAIAGAKVEGPARSAGGSSLAPAIARREAAGALAREV